MNSVEVFHKIIQMELLKNENVFDLLDMCLIRQYGNKENCRAQSHRLFNTFKCVGTAITFTEN